MLSNTQFNKWIKALRSGKYTKHCGALVGPNDSCFCALGVLAFPVLGLTLSPGLRAVLPEDDGGPFIPLKFMTPGNQNDVWQKNDLSRFSFDKIADWLESQRHGFVKPSRTKV